MSSTPYEDDARATALLNKYLEGAALRPPTTGTPKSVCIRITDVAQAGLQDLAQSLGYVRGARPNISLLLEAIGKGTLTVTQTRLQARRPQP